MDVERLARAARDLRAEALRYFTLRELLPTEGIVRAATALDEALAATEPAQAVEAVGHVHEWDYDCRGNGPFCKLCGAGPSCPGGA